MYLQFQTTSMETRCSEHKLVESHSKCLTSHISLSQGDPENTSVQLSRNTNSPRLGRHAWVWGPCAALHSNPTPITNVNNTSQAVQQPNVSHLPTASESSCLVSRIEQLQEQNFSGEVTKRNAVPQRISTWTVCKSVRVQSVKCGPVGKGGIVPLFSFHSQNQLARENSQSVSPVIIPALTTVVDRQFKEGRTIGPVWTLIYYLDHSQDLGYAGSLLFISFKKGDASDIRPATLISKQADQLALDLVQVMLMTLEPL